MIMDALLTLPLPSTIQRLRLSSPGGGGYVEDGLATCKRDLRVKYPNLSFISVDEMDINLTWDGTEMESRS